MNVCHSPPPNTSVFLKQPHKALKEIPEHAAVTKLKQTPTVTASGLHLEFR